jgi:hypothetical protein
MKNKSEHQLNLVHNAKQKRIYLIHLPFFLGSNRDLIGDRSRAHLLPRCKSRKHPDLACINPETVREE